ncbi:MAG: class I SAM-dependent rRNA methyltransferase [bacterium]
MSVNYPLLKLKKGEERRILSGHLWIYSNEVDTKATPLKAFNRGDLVIVATASGKALATAYVNPHTLICARVMSLNLDQSIDGDFIIRRLERALCLRKRLFKQPYYRWVFADADLMPGLMIDRFGDYISVQLTTAGMEKLKPEISDAILHIIPEAKIVWRNDSPIREMEGLKLYVKTLADDIPQQIEVKEGDLTANISLTDGQKTGWFYDQRHNRQLAANYAPNEDVLDVFSYIGGWGLQAALAGANSVRCVDVSAPALELLNRSADNLNVRDIVSTVNADAFEFLKQARDEQQQYGLVILDPPALIKRKKDIKAGSSAYRRLVELALQLVKKDGILILCSCSRLLSWNDMRKLTVQASRRAHKNLQIIQRLHQDEDHPIHPAIPETDYLNGYIARVY